MALSASPAADRRAALFRESLAEKATRWTLGLAWSLMPGRISGLPNLARLCFHELLAPDYTLPDPERERPARGLFREALAEQRGAAVRGGRCGKRHMIGVVGQTWVPKRVEMAKILPLVSHGRANGGLSDCLLYTSDAADEEDS